MKVKNHFLQTLFLIVVGGFAYGVVEMVFKGATHISMIIIGGICFWLIGLLNEGKRNPSLLAQMVISTCIITILEFITGLIVNVGLGLHVWDYSYIPYNLHGQICLLFTNLWFLLSLFAILLDDYVRYFFLGGKKPKYHLM